MYHVSPQMEQHIMLAIDHHRQLLEDAKRQRLGLYAQKSCVERPLRWRRLRRWVGDLLIAVGEWVKAGVGESVSDPTAKHSSETAWG